MALKHDFGNFIKSLRVGLQLTQRQAGTKAGVSAPYLAQLERGDRNPPGEEICRRLARAYGVKEEMMLREAGYGATPELEIPREQLEWAFETMCRDPRFPHGLKLKTQPLDVETKSALIDFYCEVAGIDLSGKERRQFMLLQAKVRDELRGEELDNLILGLSDDLAPTKTFLVSKIEELQRKLDEVKIAAQEGQKRQAD